NSVSVTPPVRGLLAKTLAALRGQRVIACAAIVFGRRPFRVDEALAIEPVQRLIQRGVLDGELAVRAVVDERGDPVAVHRSGRERPEHEQVESSLDDAERWRRRFHRLPLRRCGEADGWLADGPGKLGPYFFTKGATGPSIA